MFTMLSVCCPSLIISLSVFAVLQRAAHWNWSWLWGEGQLTPGEVSKRPKGLHMSALVFYQTFVVQMLCFIRKWNVRFSVLLTAEPHSLLFSNHRWSYQRGYWPDGGHKGGGLGEKPGQQAGHVCGLPRKWPVKLLPSRRQGRRHPDPSVWIHEVGTLSNSPCRLKAQFLYL